MNSAFGSHALCASHCRPEATTQLKIMLAKGLFPGSLKLGLLLFLLFYLIIWFMSTPSLILIKLERMCLVSVLTTKDYSEVQFGVWWKFLNFERRNFSEGIGSFCVVTSLHWHPYGSNLWWICLWTCCLPSCFSVNYHVVVSKSSITHTLVLYNYDMIWGHNLSSKGG